MMGKSHAITGAGLWLAGWSWTSVAGLAHPGLDVLTVGTMLCTGAALLPDLDHPESRLAHSGGLLTEKFAKAVGRIGAGIHAATKLDADRPDLDGHRTITHTIVFALFAGVMVSGVTSLNRLAGPIPVGKLVAALLVLAFTGLGYAAVRSAWGGRRNKIRFSRKGRRWHKSTVLAWTLAIYTFVIVPAGAWWIGLAIGAGCFIHCLGDIITESGCPVFWPLPIPRKEPRSPGRGQPRVPTRVWRTWYLVGTPRWMRFKVTADSSAEAVIRWSMVALSVLAAAGMIWATWWGPSA